MRALFQICKSPTLPIKRLLVEEGLLNLFPIIDGSPFTISRTPFEIAFVSEISKYQIGILMARNYLMVNTHEYSDSNTLLEF